MTLKKITLNQQNRLCDLFRDALRTLGLSKDEAQEIIANGGTMQNVVKEALKKLAAGDPRFGSAIREFELTVPTNYIHGVQVDEFAREVKPQKTTYFLSEHLTSRNFIGATNELVPGKTYRVKIFPILVDGTPSEDCLAFLKKQKTVLAGAQGLALVSQMKRNELPKGKVTVSFDKKEALPSIGGDHGVPCVFAYSGGDFGWDLGDFESGWGDRDCLLCFCDL